MPAAMEITLFATWIVLCFVASTIADRKGNSGAVAFFVSLFLSPLVGIIVACAARPNAKAMEKAALKSGKKKCPYCAEIIRAEAVLCPHCRQSLGVMPSAVEPVRLPANRKVRVSHRGTDLGEMSVSAIEQKVRAGELDSVDDHYFDAATGEWVPLGVLVEI